MRKYNKELDKIAYDAIALVGSDTAAIETLGINKNVFHKWMATHNSFKESVFNAREFYSNSSPEIQGLKLLLYMNQVLENGCHKMTYRSRTTVRTVRRNSKQQVIWIEETEQVTEREELRPIQKWIADKIKPNVGDLNAAILKVVSAGLRVSDPTLPTPGSGRLLSTTDMEAIAAIKENLLFGSQE